MTKRGILLIILILIISLNFVYAHEESSNLNENVRSSSIFYVIVGSIIILAVILFSIFYKKQDEHLKWLLFLLILIPTLLITFYISGSTIYINMVSQTGGPVHWHADFEIWNCGEEVDLVDPAGFSNRVGNPVLHEHGDNRIHVEGVVLSVTDVGLHKFFEALGASLSGESLRLPTNEGMLEIKNGDLCNNEEGKLQVFVYRIINPDDKGKWIYEQKKIEDFENYVLSPYSQVPPGDCIIAEFDTEKEKTDKLCSSYEAAIGRGELSGS